LQQAVLWIAMLGGYLNRKHDRPPGPTVKRSAAARLLLQRLNLTKTNDIV
jgi:hypothetical protein